MTIVQLADRISEAVTTQDQTYDLDHAIAFFHHHERNGIIAPTHPTSFVVDGLEWTSVEAFYQAAKHDDTRLREAIRLAPNALEAKALSKTREPDVAGMRDHVGRMRRCVMAQANLHRAHGDRSFREFLKSTGVGKIVEHHHGECDARWGACGHPMATGWNLQGRILMAVRSIIATHPLHMGDQVE